MSPSRLVLLFLAVCLLSPCPPGARAGTIYADAGGEDARMDVCMVQGKPALAWSSGTSGGIVRYVRATDADGAAWSAAVTVATGNATRREPLCLRVVNGNPAVFYSTNQGQALFFRRANDAEGASWGAVVALPLPSAPAHLYSMEVVDGNPAVCYSTGAPSMLWYARALDASGTAWAPPVLLEGGTAGGGMTLVEGRPAVAYGATGGLFYRRATDAAGTAWQDRLAVDSFARSTDDFLALMVVNGRPGIAYGDNLAWVHATDASGTSWERSQEPVPGVDFVSAMAVINGKPAFLYRVGDGPMMSWLEAADSDATQWHPAATLNFQSVISAARLFEVNGRAAVVIFDDRDHSLKYYRAAAWDDERGTRWPPFPTLSASPGVAPNAWLSLGSAALGTSKPLESRLYHHGTGSVPLVVSAAFIDGPDAAEFSIAPVDSSPVAPDSSVPFTLTYHPVKPGSEYAVLHLSTNAAAPWDDVKVTLAAQSVPEIEVKSLNGDEFSAGYPLLYPVTVPGRPAFLRFQVRNPGGADLNNLAVTIDGRDAGEFSVTAPLPPVLPPGAAAVLTVRHAPLTAGARRATLHIASNLTNSYNPYNIDLRMVPGTVDGSFNPEPGPINRLAVQPDRRILIGGISKIARLLPDGSADNSFFPPVLDNWVTDIAVLRDGNILIAGYFRHAGGLPRAGLARLLPAGDVDPSFDAGAAPDISCIAVQPDGSILVGHGFKDSDSQLHPWLERFSAAGIRDASFQPAFNNAVNALALQPDGRVLAGGPFTELAGGAAPFLVRLKSDGTRDAFAPVPFAPVRSLALRPDGEVLAAAGTGNYGDDSRISRWFADGAAAPAGLLFPAQTVHSLALQADGRCLVTGGFRKVSDFDAYGLLRFRKDGSVDEFNTQWGWIFENLLIQSDGSILAENEFALIHRLFHLTNEPAVTQLTREGDSTLRWMRGGTAPEVSDVSFELNTPGDEAWALLGFASRIFGGWELTGLHLPSLCRIRALGRSGGSLHQETKWFPSALHAWRLQYFQTPENTGPAADDADPDHDGLTNFTEFAFGLSPVDGASNALPEFRRSGDTFTAGFATPEGRENVIYRAEWSPDMSPGSWTNIPDAGRGTAREFTAPAAGDKLFVRFVVTN